MSRAAKPAARIRLDNAGAATVAEAAAVLRSARRVLVTGLREAPAAVVTAACDVAEAVGAAVDTGMPDLASPLGPVVIRAGAVTADPEELRDRADLVVAWFCDPEAHAPGFSAAFLEPRPVGGAARQVLAVGPEPVAAAGHHCRLPAEAATDAARLLHAILLGHPVDADNAAATVVTEACRQLATVIRGAGCVGFVTTRAADPLGLTSWAASLLVRAIAHERPAFEVPLAGSGRGAEPVVADILTWRYAAPGGIARADRMGAAFRPAECAAEPLIARGEVDAVLVVGELPPPVEAAITARGGCALVRIDAHDTAAATLQAVCHALRGPSPGASS